MRIRIPAQSFHAAGALMLVAVIGGPITLTLVAAHEAGLGPQSVPLGWRTVERFSLPAEQAPAPRQVALQGDLPKIQTRQGSDVEPLTAGNIPQDKSAGFLETLQDTIAVELAGKLAAPSTTDSSLEAAQSSLGSKKAASAVWPVAPSRDRLDQKLRERYLWRAWMEKAAEFHAKRTHGKSLLVYHPGEGYAVLRAAYQPMIQPVKPREESESLDRSVYQDRRNPRSAPGEVPDQLNDERPAPQPKRSEPRDLGSMGGNSFQPWDSNMMTDPFGPANALASRVPGLRIERVVLFQGFSTNGYPLESGRIPFFNQNLGYDIDVGALATISWTRARPTSGLFMVYTPSHFRRMRYSEWNSTDHELGLGATKRFRRWNLSVGSNAGVRGLAEVLFTPAVLRSVPDAPTNVDDLLNAAAGGQLSNDEIASVLTGAPVVESQPKTRFDNGRVLSSSLNAAVSYSASPRLSTNFGVNANHYQTLSSPETDDNVTGLQNVDRATSLGAGGGMDYQLSPGLSVGVNSNTRRSYSNLGESTSVNTSGTLSKRIGRNWSVNGGAGIGTVRAASLGSTGGPDRTYSSWIVNGGMHYSGREHRFSVSGARTLGDSVGIGAQVSHNVGAHWQWARPGTPWGLYSRANWYSMSLDGYRNTYGTFVGTGLTRQLSRETSFQAEYSYQMFNSPFRGVVSNLSGHRVQMSWMWRPAGEPR